MGDTSCYGLIFEADYELDDNGLIITEEKGYAKYHPYYNPLAGYVSLYNEWKRETLHLSTNIYDNVFYKRLEQLHPYEKLVLSVSIMRQGPNHICHLFETTCPLIKWNGYVSLKTACKTYVKLWDDTLSKLPSFEIYRLCEYLINKQQNKDYKPNNFVKKILEKIDYEKFDKTN